MLSAKELKEYANTLSVPAAGVCSAKTDEVLLRYLETRRKTFPVCDFEEEDLEKRISPNMLMPDAKSVLVCLFPYYIDSLAEGNLSRYAMVPDYHKVIEKILNQIIEFIYSRMPEAKCLPLCDTNPLVERHLAYRAGLGFYGKNNLFIHPVYGSYCFIGAVLLNFSLEPDQPLDGDCLGCGACIRGCPGQALSEDFGFNCERCVSYLTQKKTVSAEQEKILASQESVYGCDVCQKVCPHNQNLPNTPIADFYAEPVISLDREELSSLSGRAFKRKYDGYAFSWCSKQTILKNFKDK